jgi:hypothetical protein
MIPTIVVIPSRYQRRSLTALIDQCLRNGSVLRVLVYDNGYEPPYSHPDKRVTVVDARGWQLYRMWNTGWDFARRYGKANVVVLNDDVSLLEGALDLMALVLRRSEGIGLVCPNPDRPIAVGRGALTTSETGPYAIGQFNPVGQPAMSGFCFMLKAELPIPPVDDRFVWWCGDDDLIRKVYQSGHVGLCIDGEPVHHVGGRSARRRPELAEVKKRDVALFREMTK